MIGQYRLARALASGLPRRWAFGLADRLSDRHCDRSPVERREIAANVSVVRGEPVDEGAPAVRNVFRNFGRYLTEFLSMDRVPPSEIVVEGAHEVGKTLASLPGTILFSAHVGNWELGAVLVRRLGFPVSVVALQHADRRVNALFDGQRAKCGVGVIPLGAQATDQCTRHLRQGGVLGLLGDREFGTRSIAVACHGRAFLAPCGPALLSLRTGAPVLPIMLTREGPWRFRLHQEPVMWPPRTSAPQTVPGERRNPAERAGVEQLTQRYISMLEPYLTRYGEQWLVFRSLFGAPIQVGAGTHS